MVWYFCRFFYFLKKYPQPFPALSTAKDLFKHIPHGLKWGVFFLLAVLASLSYCMCLLTSIRMGAHFKNKMASKSRSPEIFNLWGDTIDFSLFSCFFNKLTTWKTVFLRGFSPSEWGYIPPYGGHPPYEGYTPIWSLTWHVIDMGSLGINLVFF